MSSVSLFSEGQKVLIGKFIAAFSGFVGIIIYANVLGAAGLGLYYLSHAIATIASKPGDGIGISIEKINETAVSKKSSYASTGIIITSIYVILLSISATILYNNFSILRTSTPRYSIVYLTIILFVFICFYILLGRIYSGLGEPGDSVMVDAGKGIIETILQIILLWYGFGVEGLIIGTIVSTFLAILYLLLLTPISFSKPTYDSVISIKNFAQWSIMTTTFRNIYDKMDTILIGYFVSPSAVGIYEASMRIIMPSIYVGYAIEKPLLVRVSQDIAKDKQVTPLLNKVTPYASVLSIPLFVGGIFVSSDLLSFIYGSEFVTGSSILVGGAAYYIIHTQSNVLSSFLHGYNKPIPVTKSIILGSVIRASTASLLLYNFGLIGIIPSIIITELIRFYSLRISILEICDTDYRPYRIKTQVISAITMSIIIIPVFLLLDISNPIYMFVLIFVGGLTYLTTLINIDTYIKSIIIDREIRLVQRFIYDTKFE
jgi:O-antigen/teichoic acid export membrane protein